MCLLSLCTNADERKVSLPTQIADCRGRRWQHNILPSCPALSQRTQMSRWLMFNNFNYRITKPAFYIKILILFSRCLMHFYLKMFCLDLLSLTQCSQCAIFAFYKESEGGGSAAAIYYFLLPSRRLSFLLNWFSEVPSNQGRSSARPRENLRIYGRRCNQARALGWALIRLELSVKF